VNDAAKALAHPLTIGVVGAGTMGAGIAQVCLEAGHVVRLHDVDQAAIDRGRSRVADGLERLVAKGRISSAQRDALLANLRDAPALADAARESDLVIEAALEDIDLKRRIFHALDAAAGPTAILATNTSALSVSEIGQASGHPERVVGLHFFNPAPVMPLVEVVVGSRTTPETTDQATDFAASLNKQPVVCHDSPGFIVNRVNRPFTLEALRMVDAGEVGVEQIDHAIQAAGYPMGPFALMDLVGIDVNLAVAMALWVGFDEAVRFMPSRIQSELVAAGRLGRKTGEGFYVYADGRSIRLSDQLPLDAQPATPGLADDEIVRRIELAIINEAYHAAGEGVAQPPDIDRALRLGANHPYGPFERAAQLGLRSVVTGLRALEELHGGRFRVAPALWQIASI
jgi:3-hydroxybutyryl-CoA dehydrogenase